jgi:hypothetical protein
VGLDEVIITSVHARRGHRLETTRSMKPLASLFELAVLLALSMQATIAAAGDLALYEAESFDDVGGWVTDQQAMDQMGSPTGWASP